MRVARPHTMGKTREQRVRDHMLAVGPDPKPCSLCGSMTPAGGLCGDCRDRARPHQPEDPYDDLGGED